MPILPAFQADTPAVLSKNQPDSALQVEQMAISFGGVKAVDNVDLVADSGQIVSIIGPNGAGKTTLLNLLTGFYRSEAGKINLGKLDLTKKNTREIAAAGISRTFQTTRLFNSLSVLDNLQVADAGNRLGNILLALASWRKRVSTKDRNLIELLSFVGYRGNIHARADSLAFGDRRLVEIARALAINPQVILLDEPAAGLGQQQRDSLAKLLRRLANADLSVIVIEHDLNLVMQISESPGRPRSWSSNL